MGGGGGVKAFLSPLPFGPSFRGIGFFFFLGVGARAFSLPCGPDGKVTALHFPCFQHLLGGGEGSSCHAVIGTCTGIWRLFLRGVSFEGGEAELVGIE